MTIAAAVAAAAASARLLSSRRAAWALVAHTLGQAGRAERFLAREALGCVVGWFQANGTRHD